MRPVNFGNKGAREFGLDDAPACHGPHDALTNHSPHPEPVEGHRAMADDVAKTPALRDVCSASASPPAGVRSRAGTGQGPACAATEGRLSPLKQLRKWGREERFGSLRYAVKTAEGKHEQLPVLPVQPIAIPEAWYQLAWFVLAVRGKGQAKYWKADQLALTEVMALDYPAVMPVGQKLRTASRRRPAGEKLRGLLYPGYILVGLQHLNRLDHVVARLCQCDHISGFVGLQAIRETEMVRLFDGLNAGQWQVGDQRLPRLGDLAEVRDGPFAFWQGTVVGLMARGAVLRPDTKVVIELEIMGGKRRVEVALGDLKRV